MLNKSSIIILLTLSSLTQLEAQKKLIWSDEFEGNGLADTTKWTYEEGFVRNTEAQYYTKANTNNARLEHGMLVIESRKENIDTARYTSASLTTQGKRSFLQCRIEVRAKIPMGRGTWPAIWLLGDNINIVGWPACGEIDIMENVGFDSLKIHGNIHTEAYNGEKKNNKGNHMIVNKPWDEFHIYAIDWTKNRIDFFVDGKLYFTYKKESNDAAVWPYDKAHYLILNLAIGGAWGGMKGIDDSKFPHKFYVDYVRVYK